MRFVKLIAVAKAHIRVGVDPDHFCAMREPISDQVGGEMA